MIDNFQALMTTVCPVVVFQYRPKTKGCNDLPTNVLDDLNFWVYTSNCFMIENND